MSNVLLILTSITQIGTLGPTYFIMIHMQQLLWSLVLVGQHQNMYMIEFLQVQFNPLEILPIPDSWIPDIDFKKRSLEDKQQNTIFQKSGFKFKITLMLIAFLTAWLLTQLLAMNLLALIFYFTSLTLCRPCRIFSRISSKLFQFTLFSFPLWFITENFLQLWVTLAIEINLLIGS